MNICIVFKGELLRSPNSTYHRNKKTTKLVKSDLSENLFARQNDIMESIINYIIIPY